MTLSRYRPGAVAALAGALLLAACTANGGGGSPSSAASASTAASSAASPSEAATGAVVLKVATTSAGSTLTGAGGMTLYFFAKDSTGKSACSGGCATNWPPLTVQATAGDGVQASLLGSITRDDGSTQVTYAGHPLYYYAADKAAGDANGQGVLGVWFIANPAGTLPSASAPAASSEKATPTPTPISY